MSGNSISKPVYDDSAVRLFEGREWCAQPVGKKGRYSDVIAIYQSGELETLPTAEDSSVVRQEGNGIN